MYDLPPKRSTMRSGSAGKMVALWNTGRTPSTLWSGSAGSTPCVSTAFLVLSAASTMVAPLCVSLY